MSYLAAESADCIRIVRHCADSRLLPKRERLNIARLRLHNQQIAAHCFRRPGQVAAWLGALQAQDYAGALWSIGLRLPHVTQKEIEKAIAAREIVRTWPIRGTLHFVAAEDVHWMRELLTPRIIARSALRQRQLELSAPVFARCEKIFLKALRGGAQLTREQMFALLEKARITTNGQRGYHILWRLAQEGLLCFGPHAGKQPTFTLLDEWISADGRMARDASLAELARRYFTSHGPATLQDFIAWSALTTADARDAIHLAAAQLVEEKVEGKTYWLSSKTTSAPKKSSAAYLLPGFDEYLLGYRDRSPSLDLRHAGKVYPSSNGMFISTVVIDGQVLGTWKRTVKTASITITPVPFAKLGMTALRSIQLAAKRYGKFLDREVIVSQ